MTAGPYTLPTSKAQVQADPALRGGAGIPASSSHRGPPLPWAEGNEPSPEACSSQRSCETCPGHSPGLREDVTVVLSALKSTGAGARRGTTALSHRGGRDGLNSLVPGSLKDFSGAMAKVEACAGLWIDPREAFQSSWAERVDEMLTLFANARLAAYRESSHGWFFWNWSDRKVPASEVKEESLLIEAPEQQAVERSLLPSVVQEHAEELRRFPIVVGEWRLALGPGSIPGKLSKDEMLALF
ncbi:hypothetical protein AK812_SmicGene13996 [Symbiodinium microadriaticum]|uniref:Uncharacterized protein n=1 Tax=Symbiodinium microadriaticum TaxID=2951 RepID=A0A1Q9E6N0_SYMMI|nr:hypothetical protein AK812_SmicGene13996 [Symbiodinium microadriaticum]CAE7894115.1 unnamed protein product [Symbiodinium microadriaticum]